MFYAIADYSGHLDTRTLPRVRVFRRKRSMDEWMHSEPDVKRLPQREALSIMAFLLISYSSLHTFDKVWQYIQYMTADEICAEYFDAFGGEVE